MSERFYRNGVLVAVHDIVERLRDHVDNRGGPSIENGAWQMMLEAADEIERLKAALNESRQQRDQYRSDYSL